MHPTGTGTCSRFNAPWESPSSGGCHASRRRRLMRAVRTLLTGITVMFPLSAVAQGPIQPVSYGHGGGSYGPAPYAYGPDYGYGPGCNICGPDGCGVCPETIYELLPDDRFHQGDDTCCAAFASAFQHAYLRLEYLNWNLDDPGRQLVGAQRATGGERELFNAVDPNSQVFVGLAELANYDAVGLHRNNGIRGVFGLPTRVGLFEAGVGTLEQAGAHIFKEPFFDFTTLNPVIPVVTLLNDGAPSDTTMILFSEGLNVQLQSEFFATEANFITHPLTPNQCLEIRPLCGFQYVRFWDTLDIFGTDINQGDVDDPDDDVTLNHRIRSEMKNNIFAPQVGVRFEFVHEHFSLGCTPKFLLGFNRHRDEVFSEQIFDANEGRLTTDKEDSEFAPGLDLSVYGRVHFGKHLSLFVSYQLYYLNNISRATDNVLYDSINGTQPNIVLSQHEEGIFIDGITVGGEFRFH